MIESRQSRDNDILKHDDIPYLQQKLIGRILIRHRSSHNIAMS